MRLNATPTTSTTPPTVTRHDSRMQLTFHAMWISRPKTPPH